MKTTKRLYKFVSTTKHAYSKRYVNAQKTKNKLSLKNITIYSVILDKIVPVLANFFSFFNNHSIVV